MHNKKPMTLIHSTSILCFLLVANVHNCVSGNIRHVESPAPTVHEVLQQYGFPKGLMPRSVKTYSFSSDGTFQVELKGICYVHFNKQLVYYGTQIRGNLKHGSISSMSGIQTKKSFLWLPVTGINAEEASGMLVFHIGSLTKRIPAKQFEKIHNCEKQSVTESKWFDLI